jgi:hypothetical protein
MLWAIEKPILLMVYFPFNNTQHFFRWAPKSDSKNCSCNAYKDQTTQESNQNESSRSGLQHFVWLIPQVLGKKGFCMFAAIKEINDLNMYPKKENSNSKQIPYLRSQIMSQMSIQWSKQRTPKQVTLLWWDSWGKFFFLVVGFRQFLTWKIWFWL